jgi:hypothetical protein
LLSGSLSEGGSIAWAIPAKYIAELISTNPQWSDADRIQWPPMTLLNNSWRSVYRTREISADQTIAWLNDRWERAGVRQVDDGNTIQTRVATNIQLSFLMNGSDLVIQQRASMVTIEMPTIPRYTRRFVESAEVIFRISLPNSLSARAMDRHPSDPQRIAFFCPPDRHCISGEIRRGRYGQQITDVESGLGLLRLRDIDTAERFAEALNHLIKLHGGPVPIDDLFERRSR